MELHPEHYQGENGPQFTYSKISKELQRNIKAPNLKPEMLFSYIAGSAQNMHHKHKTRKIFSIQKTNDMT